MKVGMTSGCFDLFHHSHLLFLERCRSMCDKLIVGVDSDELVMATKGPGRPIHDEMHRFSLVNSLSVVSIAFILRRLEDLDRMALDFDVDELYKCEVWRQRMLAGQTIYGASRDRRVNPKPRIVIVPDVPGMVSTTRIIERIRAGSLPVPTRE
jgi:D-beta-D-heptose 7-phosphate kinase/D-beta-D-heptose 1-phosphate adenosyltransferase